MPRLLLIFLIIPSASLAQVYNLVGQVLDGQTEEPIPFATVYLNKTTVGTSTSLEGEYTLAFNPTVVNQSSIELVISCIGYEPLVYPLTLEQLNKRYVFKLAPRQEVLDEIIVNAERDEVWYLNLETFKEEFLGRSEFGSQCEILNVNDLIIMYREEENLLQVSARAPLQIKNALLGYDIEYLLEEFTYQVSKGQVYFAGYSFYQEAKGGRLRQKQWAKNRLRAYNGSSIHFLKSVYQQQLVENGFNLRKLYRLPNPERPSEEEMQAYGEAIRAGGFESLSEAQRDIGRRARLPEFVQYLDINAVDYSSYLNIQDGARILSFPDFFQVVYTGEMEEQNYVYHTSHPFGRTRKPSYQTSVVSLTVDATVLEDNGITSNAFDLVFEGYWAWEKLGEMLPLGYEPLGEL